ncbi:unnamed protein product [Amoebophrya sp. A25]|nr:unnamed protein product [Amoebophrya sp. A25]|eukprot:GSA25T00012686001.1
MGIQLQPTTLDQPDKMKEREQRPDFGKLLADLHAVGVHVPEILLPDPSKVDMTKWGVIACDQYSAELPYWERVKANVGKDFSTLHLVYPEAYLPQKKDDEYLAKIAEKMTEYTVPLVKTTQEKLADVGEGTMIKGGKVDKDDMTPKRVCERNNDDGNQIHSTTIGADGTPTMSTPTCKTTSAVGGANVKADQTPFLPDAHVGFMLIDRSTPTISSRRGLVLSLDLEQYDYSPDSQTLIRATEKTVVERLPIRAKIRENASLELPHIVILVDDPKDQLLGPLFAKKEKLEVAYDFDLMENAGHIKGWKLRLHNEFDALQHVAEVFHQLKADHTHGDSAPMLFAVGDGNHSLAAAKVVWESTKKRLNMTPEQAERHPARYALVEIQNIHDDSIEFEPIHRLMYDMKPSEFMAKMQKYCDQVHAKFEFEQNKVPSTSEENDGEGEALGESGGENKDVAVEGEEGTKQGEEGETKTEQVLAKNEETTSPEEKTDVHEFIFVTPLPHESGKITISKPNHSLGVGFLQMFLDSPLCSGSTLEYIHGEDSLRRLVDEESNGGVKNSVCGVILPPIGSKTGLFAGVQDYGVLPRKSFSMGHADDKRFYIEARRIRPVEAKGELTIKSPKLDAYNTQPVIQLSP